MDFLGDVLTRWIEIDTDIIKHNVKQIKNSLNNSTKLMAVVKGDAYGCGSVGCAAALKEDSDMFGVTTLEEAVELRQGAITTPILVFSPLLPKQADLFVRYSLTATVVNTEGLFALAQAAGSDHAYFHIKIETGMGRLGVKPEELPQLLDTLSTYPQLKLEGIYTHFAKASHEEYVKKQVQKILKAKEILSDKGFNNLIVHACASAGFLKYPQYHFDMVRIGTLLYGQLPAGIPSSSEFKDPWSFKASILQLKDIKAGESVGYGRDFIASRPIKVALLPIGLADGFSLEPPLRAKSFFDLLKIIIKEILKFFGRPHSISGTIIHKGKSLPIIGRVGMQLLAVDVTAIEQIEKYPYLEIGIRRTSVSARIARVYFKDKRLVSVRSIAGEELLAKDS